MRSGRRNAYGRNTANSTDAVGSPAAGHLPNPVAKIEYEAKKGAIFVSASPVERYCPALTPADFRVSVEAAAGQPQFRTRRGLHQRGGRRAAGYPISRFYVGFADSFQADCMRALPQRHARRWLRRTVMPFVTRLAGSVDYSRLNAAEPATTGVPGHRRRCAGAARIGCAGRYPPRSESKSRRMRARQLRRGSSLTPRSITPLER
jgi:hypothetical protein